MTTFATYTSRQEACLLSCIPIIVDQLTTEMESFINNPKIMQHRNYQKSLHKMRELLASITQSLANSELDEALKGVESWKMLLNGFSRLTNRKLSLFKETEHGYNRLWTVGMRMEIA